MLPAETLLALAAQCAPAVAPQTLLAIAQAESGLDPYAIGINGPRAPRPTASTASEAAATAHALIAAGRDVDLGLTQINVRNLPRLGLSIEDAFDPCRNLAAGARVLRDGYARAVTIHGLGQAALRVALSYYNTGHPVRGFDNGYVARVTAWSGAPRNVVAPVRVADPSREHTDVFGRAAGRRLTVSFVFTPAGATP